MFGWLGDILAGIGDAIGVIFDNTVGELIDSIWTEFIRWIYNAIYDAMADLFSGINYMGAEIFNLSWVNAVIQLFTLLGWSLFVAGVAMAVFDLAIECQNSRTSVKTTALNVLKGFFACSLIGVVPVELYRFCVSLQNTFAHDLIRIFTGSINASFGDFVMETMAIGLNPTFATNNLLLTLLTLIAFCYCVIKIFFANIKRGGILLIQMAVGELYMFSLPRGYADGFWQWCKQVAAICLTSFLQTTLLFLGLMTFQDNMLMGLGIMLAANEVPKIAQQFGLDSSVRFNVSSVVYTTSSAVNMARTLAKPK
ncbi:MAG: conjugal transfer protein TrbL family protein [Faecousia sp.]